MAQCITLPVRKDSLGEKLKNYSLLAGSILAPTFAAHGQIVYTDLIPDVTLGGVLPATYPDTSTYALDLNNDGVFDFNITLTILGTDSGAAGPSFIETMDGDFNPQYNKMFIYHTGQYAPWAIQVPCGNLIPLVSYSNASHFANISFQVGAAIASNWQNVHDRVIGLSFKMDTAIHYGWVRLDVNTLDSIPNIVIKDYAYDATPVHQVTACDTISMGIPNSINRKNEVRVFPNPSDGKCVLKFKTPLKSEVELSVTDVFGQKVFGTTILLNSEEVLPFDFSHLASGIYLIQLKSEEGSLTQKWIKK